MDDVHDEMANDSACGKRKRVESVPLSRCGFQYLEVKICCKHALGPIIQCSVRCSEFTGVRFSEVASDYKYGIINQ